MGYEEDECFLCYLLDGHNNNDTNDLTADVCMGCLHGFAIANGGLTKNMKSVLLSEKSYCSECDFCGTERSMQLSFPICRKHWNEHSKDTE